MLRSIAVGVVLAGMVSGCSLGSNEGAGPAPFKLQQYTGHGYTFTYPASWRYRHGGFSTTMTEPVIDLATQPMGEPCHGSLGCAWPVTRMRPGGVVVMVQAGGLLSDRPRPARLTFRTYGSGHSDSFAARIGCDRVFTATYEPRSTGHGENLYFSACARGPGLATVEQQFRDMVKSARPVKRASA
jgi:hypothetical protein